MRKSKIALAVRYLLMVSLGTSCPVLAEQWSVGLLPAKTDRSVRSENVTFNDAFFHGQDVDVSRYVAGNPAPAGEYMVQVSVNDQSRGQHKILFIPVEGNASAEPCFKQEILTLLGIKFSASPLEARGGDKAKTQCATIDKWVTGASANYETGDFHLNLVVPQASLVQHPRGYTDPNSWDSGFTVGLLDYHANVYAQQSSSRISSSSDDRNVSGNLGLLAGVNISEWRLRKRLNTAWNRDNSTHTQSLVTYLQRDVPALKSQLTLGDSTTSGDVFDSMTIRGIQLQSDDRMQPDGLRYYTPLVRGVAETNARVQVTQRGQPLYETTVPPGPFELSDIGAMGYGGDLQVIITEADGRRRTQVVPFSSPPMLLHDGTARFGVTVGKLQDNSLVEEPSLAQAFYQYGLGNMYTLYGGGQFADNYRAIALGNAFNTPFGGVSIDMTRARSNLANGKSSSGNSYNVAFSKYLETTSTDVTLAAYRYNSEGFYSFRDAALDRYGAKNNDFMVDYRTRQRFTVNVGQPLWNGARLNFSGSFYRYWNDRSSTSQYMLAYNKTERHFSWGVSASRAYDSEEHNVDSVMLSVSVPLGRSSITEKPLFSSLYSSVNHDSDGGTGFQANAIGSQGEQNEFTYGVGSSINKTKSSGTRNVFNGNVNYNSPYGQLGSTASVGNKSSQLSLTANGSLVAHSGGITVGPRLGDSPFALVDAQGAEGAKMVNGYGSRIDANGYAIVPSLTPYRENTVAVSTRGLPETVDVLESESAVIPRMGAAVKVKVKTQVGNPVVLIVKNSRGELLSIGTDIYDEQDISRGIIGQGGMVFIRGWEADKYNLYVKSASGQRLCTIYADNNIAKKITSAQGAVTQVGVICH